MQIHLAGTAVNVVPSLTQQQIPLEESVPDQDDSPCLASPLPVGSPDDVPRIGHYGPEGPYDIRLEDCHVIIDPSERMSG